MFTFILDMEVDTIIEGSLYAIHWEDDEHNSLDQMAILYSDVEYLEKFFDENREGLKYYKRPSYTPQDAIIRTIQETDALIQELKEFATNSLSNKKKVLDDLFEPLHTDDAFNHPRYYTDVKAKGYPDEAPWLRVYAVKCDENLYVITGYGLKLVRDMRDDEDLLKELSKLDIATHYLKSIMMIVNM